MAGTTPKPCSASADAGPTYCSRCSVTGHSTNRSRRPQSPDLRRREENNSICLNVVAEHRMTVVAFRVHQHGLTQPPPDLPKEAAEHIEPFLALQLAQVYVEVDFIVGAKSEDHQRVGGRPDPQFRALGILRAGQHSLRPGTGSTASPSEYWYFQPISATRSRTACQSSAETSGTRTSGNDPIKSGSNNHFTSHSRLAIPPCWLARRPSALPFPWTMDIRARRLAVLTTSHLPELCSTPAEQPARRGAGSIGYFIPNRLVTGNPESSAGGCPLVPLLAPCASWTRAWPMACGAIRLVAVSLEPQTSK